MISSSADSTLAADKGSAAYLQYALSANVVSAGQGVSTALPFNTDLSSNPLDVLQYVSPGVFQALKSCVVKVELVVEGATSANSEGWLAYLLVNTTVVAFSNNPGNSRSLQAESTQNWKTTGFQLLPGQQLTANVYQKENTTLTVLSAGGNTGLPATPVIGTTILIEVMKIND